MPRFFMLSVFGVLLAACGAGEVVDTSIEDVRKKGEIVVGFDDGFAPMGFHNDKGDVVGFDIDLAREAAKRLGLRAVFKACDWNRIFVSLTNREIDLIWNGLTITPERGAQMALTRPYMTNRQLIVVKKGAKLKSKNELSGKRIGVQKGSTSESTLLAIDGFIKKLKELKTFADNTDALQDLAAGKIDAVVVDEVVGRYYISKKAGVYVMLDDDFGRETYGVGLRAADRKLHAEIERVLGEMKGDGTLARISAMWFARQPATKK